MRYGAINFGSLFPSTHALISAKTLQKALDYLAQVIQRRITTYFSDNSLSDALADAPMPKPLDWLVEQSALSGFIQDHQLDRAALKNLRRT
ncbi:MAG: hypothetical protein HC879_10435 [Leptolyngbyaceae cyanobacterium SL_5_9]|nr:hypothetical protein [Leptolyngbyaceae cyanobacterium SL_5_9]NJO74377.1 hypothetical protein [Leptolyngbyaceae cyanobacterium RM1_406_9]